MAGWALQALPSRTGFGKSLTKPGHCWQLGTGLVLLWAMTKHGCQAQLSFCSRKRASASIHQLRERKKKAPMGSGSLLTCNCACGFPPAGAISMEIQQAAITSEYSGFTSSYSWKGKITWVCVCWIFCRKIRHTFNGLNGTYQDLY